MPFPPNPGFPMPPPPPQLLNALSNSSGLSPQYVQQMQSQIALMQQAGLRGFNYSHPNFSEMMGGGSTNNEPSSQAMKNAGQQPFLPPNMSMLPQLAAQSVGDIIEKALKLVLHAKF
mgnify:CR=1 FL=1